MSSDTFLPSPCQSDEEPVSSDTFLLSPCQSDVEPVSSDTFLPSPCQSDEETVSSDTFLPSPCQSDEEAVSSDTFLPSPCQSDVEPVSSDTFLPSPCQSDEEPVSSDTFLPSPCQSDEEPVSSDTFLLSPCQSDEEAVSSDTFILSPCQSDVEPVSSDTFLPSPCQSDEEPVSSDTFLPSPCQSDVEPVSSDTFLPSPCQSDEEPVSSDTFLPSPCQSDEEPVSSDTFLLSPCQSDEEPVSSDTFILSPCQSDVEPVSSDTFLPSPCQSDEEAVSSDTFLPSPCQSDEETVLSDTFLPSPCQSDVATESSDTFILSPCQSDEEPESSDSYVSSPYQSSDEDAHPECMAARVETNVLQPKHDVGRDAHQQFILTEDETVNMTSDELKGLHIYPQGFREFLASSHKHVEKGLVKLLCDTNAVVYGNTCVLETLSTKQTPPSSLLFDVCIFRPSQPLLLISVTSQHDSTTVLYNSALARKVKTFMRREIKPNFSLVHGVVEESEFKLEESLRSQVNALATQAMWVSLPHSLFMDRALCKMITANFIGHVQHDTIDQSKDAGTVQPSPPQIQEAKHLCGNEVNLKKVMQYKEQLQMNQSWPKETEPSRARVSSEETEFNPQDIEELGDIVYHLGVFERKDVGEPKCPEQTSESTNPCVFHDPMMQMMYILSGMTLGGADEIPDMAEDSLVSSCGSKILLLHGDDDALPTDEGKGMQRLMAVLSKIDWIVLWRHIRRLVVNTKKEIIHLQAKMEYLQHLLQDNTSLNQINSRKIKIPGRKIPEDDAEYKPFFVHRLNQDKCRFATRGQVHQLRQFQQGILRHKHMFEIIRNGIHADTDRRSCLQTHETLLEKDYGCVHMIGEVGSSRAYHVVCPTLHFDTSLVNTMFCDVTRRCELVNTSSFNTSEHNDATRLQNYSGTRSSTAIPLHPPASMLPGPQYWECHTRVTPRKPIGAWLTLLEVGVCEESQVDTGVWLYSRPRSWSVRVGGCSWHRSSICTFVYDGEQNVHCTLDTMCNTPDTTDYISYGVVLDVVRGRLAFIDLNREAVLSMIDVEFGEALCPTFGVGPWSNEYSIRMQLISGKNIKLTESKKSLIHKVLS